MENMNSHQIHQNDEKIVLRLDVAAWKRVIAVTQQEDFACSNQSSMTRSKKRKIESLCIPMSPSTPRLRCSDHIDNPLSLIASAPVTPRPFVLTLSHDSLGVSIDNCSPYSQVIRQIKKYFSSASLTNSVVSIEQHEAEQSAIGILRNVDIGNHIISLQIEHIQSLVRPILRNLMQHPRNVDLFNVPVDPVLLGLTDYFQRISNPMDLGTIRSRLNRGMYESVSAVAKDIMLVFKNAMVYNDPENSVHQLALELSYTFENALRELEHKVVHDVRSLSLHTSPVI